MTAPLTALAPAASLVWLLDVRPRALLGDAALAPAVAELIPDATFASLSRLYGVDLRTAEELTVAAYPEAELLLVRAFLDPAKLEAAFAARTVEVEGRGDRSRGLTGRARRPHLGNARGRGARAAGDVRTASRGVSRWAASAPCGRARRSPRGSCIARRPPSPLLRSRRWPAWSTMRRCDSSLPARSTTRPARARWPGRPAGRGHGRGSHAHAARGTGRAPTLELTVVLAGFWDRPGDGRPPADAVFLRQFQALANSAPGRLIGVDGTLEPPRVKMSRETLVLTARYDAESARPPAASRARRPARQPFFRSRRERTSIDAGRVLDATRPDPFMPHTARTAARSRSAASTFRRARFEAQQQPARQGRDGFQLQLPRR